MEDKPSFIDTHAHLAMLEHAAEEQILDHAGAMGVSKIITVSTNETSWEPNRRLANQHANIYYSLGVHPHEARHWAVWGSALFQRFEPIPTVPKKCVAIGETGLDFFYEALLF